MQQSEFNVVVDETIPEALNDQLSIHGIGVIVLERNNTSMVQWIARCSAQTPDCILSMNSAIISLCQAVNIQTIAVPKLVKEMEIVVYFVGQILNVIESKTMRDRYNKISLPKSSSWRLHGLHQGFSQ